MTTSSASSAASPTPFSPGSGAVTPGVTQHDTEVYALRSMRFTLFVFSVMVWGWGFLLLNAVQQVSLGAHLLLPLLPAIPLFLLTLRFSSRLRGLGGPRLFGTRRAVWLYVLGNVLTVTGYVLATIVAHASHHPEYVVPGATLAVGLHFLFIALAFRSIRTYFTMAVFCLTALLVPLVVPLQFSLGPLTTFAHGGGWQVVTSLICLLWLSLFAIRLLIVGERDVRRFADGR